MHRSPTIDARSGKEIGGHDVSFAGSAGGGPDPPPAPPSAGRDGAQPLTEQELEKLFLALA
jgi:hypothetical protein